MGFEILPSEENDIDVENPKYDIFALTSTQKWIPSRFCAEEDPIEIEDHPDIDVASGEAPVDNIADTLHIDPTTVIYNRHPTKLDTIQRIYAMVSMKHLGIDIPGKQDTVHIPLAQAMIWKLSLSTEVTATDFVPFKATLSAT